MLLSGLQSETGKDWRRSLYIPTLPNYQPEALTQTLSLWEPLSHLTTLQKASIPTSMVPWPGAANMLAGERGSSFSCCSRSALCQAGVWSYGARCRRREINQEGFAPMMHTWTLGQGLGRKFSWEWKLHSETITGRFALNVSSWGQSSWLSSVCMNFLYFSMEDNQCTQFMCPQRSYVHSRTGHKPLGKL